VHVDYGDIYNAKALVELTGGPVGIPDEPSLGTHFSKTCWKGRFTQLPLILVRINSNVNFLKQVLIIYPIGSHPKRVWKRAYG